MTEEQFHREVMKHTCPHCKAAPPESCRTWSGQKAKYHAARADLVRQAYFKKKREETNKGTAECPMCLGKGRIKVTHE